MWSMRCLYQMRDASALVIVFLGFFNQISSQELKCGHPAVPVNARVALSSPTLAPGTLATYQCDEGYETFGNTQTSCSPSGQWAGELPFCDDPLQFILQFMGFGLKKYLPWVKIMTLICSATCTTLIICFIVDLFRERDWDFAKHYCPLMLYLLSGSCIILLIYACIDEAFLVQDIAMKYFWSVNLSTATVKNRILQDVKAARLLIGIYITSTIAAAPLWYPLSDDDIRTNYTYLFYVKLFGKHTGIFYIFSTIFFAIIYYGTALQLVVLLYCSYHIKFQFYLLIEHLDKLTCLSKDKVEYQELIYSLLSVCISHHANIKRATKAMRDLGRAPILLMPFVGSTTIVAGLYFIISDISPRNNYKVVFSLLNMVVSILINSFGGQMVEDVIARMIYSLLVFVVQIQGK